MPPGFSFVFSLIRISTAENMNRLVRAASSLSRSARRELFSTSVLDKLEPALEANGLMRELLAVEVKLSFS
jgi:hypothetical protein